MGINVVYSRSGTGKSLVCLERMKEVIGRGEKAYMIVPEQFSYEAERRISEHMKGTGINGAEALTFSGLLRLISPEVNMFRLDGAGKQMLVYKAVEKAGGINSFSGLSSRGFLDAVADMIREFKKFNISDNDLERTNEILKNSDNAGSDMLKGKFETMKSVYEIYNQSIKDGGFADSDDDMARLAECIYSGDKLSDVHIFIDEFYSFIPYHYGVIAAMAVKAADVTIFLCADHEAKLSYDTDNIFSPCTRIIYTLEGIAKERGIIINEEHLPENPYRFKGSEELALIEQTFDRSAQKIFDGEPKDIKLFTARDIFSEVEAAALEIIRAAGEGARYREIGILCGDLENYADIIEAVFKKYNIPYFMDMKRNITNHPVIMAVMSIFDIFTQGWSYEAVFSYIRTGFSTLDDKEADELEIFVLAHGIRGEKRWCGDDWEYNDKGIFGAAYETEENNPAEWEEDIKERKERINAIRKKLIKPFTEFKSCFNGRKTIREICTALYDMLDSGLNMPGNIENEARRLIDEGRNDESEQFLRLWDMLISLLDQTVNTMGDDYCGFERFGEIMLAGFSKYEIGIIPSSADRVTVGTVDRSRSTNIREMLIIGASSSNIPKQAQNTSLFSESERKKLNEGGLEIECGKSDKLFDDLFKIYKAVTAAKERLYISWSAADWEGSEMRPAEFVHDIIRRFPDIKIENNMNGTPVEKFLDAPADAVFAHILSGWAEGKDARFEKLMSWYENDERYAERVGYAQRVKDYKREAKRIGAETVRKLYETDPVYSISRFETFAKCPFRYFMSYGIHAKPQKIWRVESYDMGNFIHYYIDKFCRIMENERMDDSIDEAKRVWRECTEEKYTGIIETLLEDAKEKIARNDAGGRINYMIEMIKRSLLSMARDLIKSLDSGEFALYKTEVRFDGFTIKSERGDIRINGVIDRIDLLKNGNDVYIRVIDYKTGSKYFDLTELYNNTEFQLFIYAQAAEMLYRERFAGKENTENTKIAGVLYFSLKNDYERADSFPELDEIANDLKNMKKLDGVIVDDLDTIEVTKMMDRNIGSNINGKMCRESEYFKVKLKDDEKPDMKSMIVSPGNFEKMCGYVNAGIKDIYGKINDGDISIYPYAPTSSKGVCAYCDYKDICMFDDKTDKYKERKTFTKPKNSFQKKVNDFTEVIKNGGNDR
ncbi:MAG: exodeoxyribonuclease V subunit gamma [Oscillospiraceae bacterium]|nr:exodeoxyribonuclease V subunit gamma [Oscillospiraceae bacterium]